MQVFMSLLIAAHSRKVKPAGRVTLHCLHSLALEAKKSWPFAGALGAPGPVPDFRSSIRRFYFSHHQ